MKWIGLSISVLGFIGCTTTRDYEINMKDVFVRMDQLKPQFADCWRRLQPEESADSLSMLTLEGPLQSNGRFRYIDVNSVPQATKSTQACIEKLVTDEQFLEQKLSTMMTFKIKY